MYPTLTDFIDALEQRGELKRIAKVTSPVLEVARLADLHANMPAPRTSEHAMAFDPGHAHLGGHALYFENVEGCDFPLVINTFGSYTRMEMALGRDASGGFTAIANRIGSLVKPEPPRSFGEMFSKAREFLPLLRVPPKRVKHARCQAVVKLAEKGEVDLTRLPIIKCWPLDG
ncbi:MAG: UbiD family decarboxylase, partial [Phycisphaerales bacterium]|nr:UbiD family decarboxylase [Phycisphaerales bacterium]